MEELPVIPNEIYCKIFSSLDLLAIRKVREVSKLWKTLVPHACRNLHFVCQLTDDNLHAAVSSDEFFPCLEIQDFSGKENEIVSSTTGTGFLFGNADSIKFTGNNIEPGEIPKMMQFAMDFLKMLEFKNCAIDTLRPFTQAKQAFNAVQELSITYTQFPTANDTSALEGLATPELGPILPALKRFKIFLDIPDYTSFPSCEDIFLNYLAIGKLIAKYRNSLKDIEIKRNFKLRMITSVLMRAQNALTLSPDQLMRRQQSLKELVINYTVVMIEDLPNLTTWLPTNQASLTSIKITLEVYGNGPMNLEAFRGCPDLKILWLEFFHEVGDNDRHPIWESSSQVTNVEALPKTISSLRLKCDNQDMDDRHRKHQLYILSTEQMEWIINNLRDLESLWAQLVVAPKRNGNGQQTQPNANRRPNMTLETFDGVISLPKLKELKLDMLKVKQLEANFGAYEEDVVEDKEFEVFVLSLGEIQDYLDACKNSQQVRSVCLYPVQGQELRFWELTIHVSNSVTKVA